jgi:hypothetical protein
MNRKPFTDQGIAQRGIILHALRDDHSARWTRAELEHELYDVKETAIAKALTRLEAKGVVHLEDDEVWASSCALHLDELGMVSI